MAFIPGATYSLTRPRGVPRENAPNGYAMASRREALRRRRGVLPFYPALFEAGRSPWSWRPRGSARGCGCSWIMESRIGKGHSVRYRSTTESLSTQRLRFCSQTASLSCSGSTSWRRQESHPPDPSGGGSSGSPSGSHRQQSPPREMNDRTTNGHVKVLLADNHTLFRQGLAGLLTSYGGMEVVGETNNDRGAVELARKKKPDAVIMQVQLPFERARKSLEELREIWPPPKIVVVTMFEEP